MLKPIETTAGARNFVRNISTFHSEKAVIKRNEIAAQQVWLLRPHYSGKLRLEDDNSTPQVVFNDMG